MDDSVSTCRATATRPKMPPDHRFCFEHFGCFNNAIRKWVKDHSYLRAGLNGRYLGMDQANGVCWMGLAFEHGITVASHADTPAIESFWHLRDFKPSPSTHHQRCVRAGIGRFGRFDRTGEACRFHRVGTGILRGPRRQPSRRADLGHRARWPNHSAGKRTAAKAVVYGECVLWERRGESSGGFLGQFVLVVQTNVGEWFVVPMVLVNSEAHCHGNTIIQKDSPPNGYETELVIKIKVCLWVYNTPAPFRYQQVGAILEPLKANKRARKTKRNARID